MAHPKRKISKTRRDKRRTHYKLLPLHLQQTQQLVSRTFPQSPLARRKMYYRGQVVIDATEQVEA